jgi:hypothetical protein
VCVRAPQCPELIFSPSGREAHQFSCGEAWLPNVLAEFRAETAQGAAVLGHHLALGGELPDEGLQSAFWGSVMSVDEREGQFDLLCVGFDDRRDDFVPTPDLGVSAVAAAGVLWAFVAS